MASANESVCFADGTVLCLPPPNDCSTFHLSPGIGGYGDEKEINEDNDLSRAVFNVNRAESDLLHFQWLLGKASPAEKEHILKQIKDTEKLLSDARALKEKLTIARALKEKLLIDAIAMKEKEPQSSI